MLDRRDPVVASPVSEMLDRRDQLPHMRIERSCRPMQISGTLADHADVPRGGDDFVDTERALVCTVGGERKRKPGDRWKWISVKLREEDKSETRSNENKRRTKSPSSFGNWPSSAGSHLS